MPGGDPAAWPAIKDIFQVMFFLSHNYFAFNILLYSVLGASNLKLITSDIGHFTAVTLP